MVERTLIAPPMAQVGPIDRTSASGSSASSPLRGKYDQPIDQESAYEMLAKRAQKAAAEASRRGAAASSTCSGGSSAPPASKGRRSPSASGRPRGHAHGGRRRHRPRICAADVGKAIGGRRPRIGRAAPSAPSAACHREPTVPRRIISQGHVVGASPHSTKSSARSIADLDNRSSACSPGCDPSISTDPAYAEDCRRPRPNGCRAISTALGVEARLRETGGHPVVLGHRECRGEAARAVLRPLRRAAGRPARALGDAALRAAHRHAARRAQGDQRARRLRRQGAGDDLRRGLPGLEGGDRRAAGRRHHS